jgi:hypothetical protein
MFPAIPTTITPPRGPSHAEDVRYSSDKSSSESDSESESDSNVDDKSSKLMSQHQSVAPPYNNDDKKFYIRLKDLRGIKIPGRI